jgi:hypothetical protein
MKKNKKVFDVPILFLIYKNPKITKLTFNQIKKIKPTILFISADGPASDKDREECKLTRKIIEEIDWPCKVEIKFHSTNLGLKKAVSSGISWFFSKVAEGIILEYDCFPNMDFFYFCQEMLKRYRRDNNIFSISGSNLQGGVWRGDGDYYYSHFFGCWGWATWRRSWRHWSPNLSRFEIFESQNLIRNILLDPKISNSYMRILSDVHSGRNKTTWSFCFEYAQICQGSLSVVPNRNLISNIGFGSHATHAKNVNHPIANIPTAPLQNFQKPSFKIADLEADTLQNKKAFYIPAKDFVVYKLISFVKYILPEFIIILIKQKKL